MSRGVLIVFEGLDRSGKSTQAKRLLEHINSLPNRKAVLIPFPDRSTPSGQIIDKYLRKEIDLNENVLHLHFSANRWEKAEFIQQQISNGVDVICDRYAFSGVAYSIAKGDIHDDRLPIIAWQVFSGGSLICSSWDMIPPGAWLDSHWTKQPDVGLPEPDAVFFFKVSPEVAKQRGGFGEERLETESLQQKVAAVIETLRQDYWKTVNADADLDTVEIKVQELYKQMDRSHPPKSIQQL